MLVIQRVLCVAVKSRHLWYANVHIFYLTSNKFAQIKAKCVEKHNIYKKKRPV